jgi:hypothetical protein
MLHAIRKCRVQRLTIIEQVKPEHLTGLQWEWLIMKNTSEVQHYKEIELILKNSATSTGAGTNNLTNGITGLVATLALHNACTYTRLQKDLR